MKKSVMNNGNILLNDWEGPHNGFPPLDKVSVSDFKPALLAAMAELDEEVESIVATQSPPTFENTILALERAGKKLNRVIALFYIWSGNLNCPDFQLVDTEMQPELAAFYDKQYQNNALFQKIETIYESMELGHYSDEQKILIKKYHQNYVLKGAKLSDDAQIKVAAINQKLAVLQTKFSQNLLADEESKFLELAVDQLAGLPEALVENAAMVANSKGQTGWIISNTRSSIDPFLTYSSVRSLREQAWKMFVNRGDNGDENDNKAIISEILELRAERAKLFGFETHAHWKLVDKMAKTPENAMKLLEDVWKPALKRVREEVTDMQAIADQEGHNIKIEPWDYRYYAEKVRKAKFDLDENEVKPYLQLDQMRASMFWMAGELFDIQFDQLYDVPVYHEDVKVWKVSNKTSGKQIGLWYFDPYAREGKRSGAWMNAYRDQSHLYKEETTIVSNNSNFIKGKPGEPVLISFDDAKTLFHEFGHALHGLCSNVTYPSLSGTNVATDYVEFPSQILERWLTTPEILNKFALHYKTGKTIPQDLLERIDKASKFNSGFNTLEYLASALIDMKLHLAGDQKIDPEIFEKSELAKMGMPKEIVMRHRTPQFGHIFSDDGYSAGYYSYLWSDVLSSDAYTAFTEAEGPYDKKVGKRLKENVFSVGSSVDESEGYRAFRGKDPSIEALMASRGF